jgi:hypothetical protein
VLRAVVVAGGLLSLLAGGEWALQAVALGRPPAAELQLVRTLRALSVVHGSQARLLLDGRPYEAVCTQAWYPHRRLARVVTPLGHVTQVGDRLRGAGPLDAGAFDLAGCPRPLLRWLSAELVRGASVELQPRSGAYEVTLHPDVMPVRVFVAPSSGLPVRLTLKGTGPVQGTSRVRYGTLR